MTEALWLLFLSIGIAWPLHLIALFTWLGMIYHYRSAAGLARPTRLWEHSLYFVLPFAMVAWSSVHRDAAPLVAEGAIETLAALGWASLPTGAVLAYRHRTAFGLVVPVALSLLVLTPSCFWVGVMAISGDGP